MAPVDEAGIGEGQGVVEGLFQTNEYMYLSSAAFTRL